MKTWTFKLDPSDLAAAEYQLRERGIDARRDPRAGGEFYLAVDLPESQDAQALVESVCARPVLRIRTTGETD